MARAITQPKSPVGPAPVSFGSPTRVIGTTLAVFLASQFAVLVITWLAAGVSGQNINHLYNLDWYQTLVILLSELFAIGLIIRVVRSRRLSLASIGLGRRPMLADFGKGILGWLAFLAVFLIIGSVLNSVSPGLNQEQQNVGFNSINTGLDRSLAFIALVIFPPLGEEVLFRGYLFSGLRKLWRFWPALLVTSLLFGAPHLLEANHGLLWSGAIETFVLSVFLCFLREKTGALYAGILVHMLNNLIAFGVHFH
ncbi:MAG TPA: type II CAAX endopeptidase family protein [Candidatus Saccharimonadales bacterium]|nr:type II CAAX endopeptidase family protein [Candidatus Saccharimonadales bacterium]